ncbi:MAG: phosphotransferase enzyme family protein [Acidimicrobiia bacterium]
MDADAIAERFGLGEPLTEPTIAAAGWGERNRVWRLATTTGVFAVKDTHEELLPIDIGQAFRIELAAHNAGIPSASPIRSIHDGCYETIDGRWYRCHRWADGSVKQNEDTSAGEAHAMGIVVARLHGLAIPADPSPPAEAFGRGHWLEAARLRPHAAWARAIEDHIDNIDAAESRGSSVAQEAVIGTHRDLNAHNVLFTPDGPVLIDWDAAGPASVRYERAATATLWAQRHDGGLDIEVASAFLRGYIDGGGVVDRDDASTLPLWLRDVAWWTDRNVKIAISQPSEHHEHLAALLVKTLADGLEAITRRQRLYHAAVASL